MKPRTRIILLSVISILIVVTIVLGVTYSFMQANIDTSSVTEVSLSSCAKITLSDTGASINLNNTNPISKNRALQTTPYTFTVTSSCESYVGFNLYLATLNTNTLVDSSIHYIITRNGSKDILAEGILSEATNALSEFTSDDQNQLNVGINGTFGTIYKLYNEDIPLQGEVSYDLYLYIDSEVTDASTMGKTFNAGIAVKSYDREADPTTLADYIINEVYTGTDGVNDLYYHDGIGSYTNADQEAGDNSYRYAGANPNNYVCFGATGADCQNADNQYRISGVFNGQVKLIKATSYGRYAWERDYNTQGNTWDASTKPDIYTTLNTTYYNTLGSEWQNLIAESTWEVGGMVWSETNTAKQYYDVEVGIGQSGYVETMKVGLMYVSDYGYGASPEKWTTALAYPDGENYGTDNWLYSGDPEWFISRSTGYTDAAFVVSSGRGGDVNNDYVDRAYAVRPSFSLTSTVTISSGTGTSTDPFVLNLG